jgi:carnitine 3-dehydrogenase
MPAETYLRPEDIRSVAVIGTGSVGASWACLFLAHGMSVVAHDPAPEAEARARDFVTNAWPALRELGIATADAAPLHAMRFVGSAAEAVKSADLIQENIPEKPELKARLLREIDAAATPDKIILSSTGGIPPTSLQAACAHPQRLVVVHPFNPSHLIPLVEVVGGKLTDPAVVDWALAFARLLGKQPIRLNVEASGHMTNRLQFALVREAVACLVEGIASAKDIDAAVRYGLGPRWTLMGSLLTLHLAGGPGGMKGILDHAGAAIEEWWTPMTQPRLTPEVKEQLVRAAVEVSAGASVADWVQWRDENLVNVLKLQHASEAEEPRRD